MNIVDDKLIIDFDEDIKNKIINWINLLNKTKYIRNQNFGEKQTEREIYLDNNPLDIKCKKYLQKVYNSGYGYKVIARSIGISYTQIRSLFNKYLNLDVRTGRKVVTKKTKQFRKERVLGELSPWHDWPNQKPEMIKNNTRGIQGYYKKKDNEYVWLRSTWEYIFAKWLDARNLIWKVEYTCFTLKNGEKYRPDFFIFDDTGSLSKIIEIKGYWKNRLHKAIELKETNNGLEVIIIENILHFTDNYNKDLSLWKQQRLLKKELKKLQSNKIEIPTI